MCFLKDSKHYHTKCQNKEIFIHNYPEIVDSPFHPRSRVSLLSPEGPWATDSEFGQTDAVKLLILSKICTKMKSLLFWSKISAYTMTWKLPNITGNLQIGAFWSKNGPQIQFHEDYELFWWILWFTTKNTYVCLRRAFLGILLFRIWCHFF